MQKFLLSFFFFALIIFRLQAQSGIFESYAILSVNGGANTYYDLQASTANPDFQGANLGTFIKGTNTLVVKGGENKTHKCPPCDITGGHFYYRVYPTGSTPPTTFVQMAMGFNSNLGTGTCGNDQKWDVTNGTTNLIAALAPMSCTYTLEVYTDAPYTGCGSGTHYSSNGGANYKATFTVIDATTALNGTYVIPSLCFPTIASAVNTLNNNGISGAVTFNVAAGYTETLTGRILMTATGTAANPIIFQKSGTGANPVITSYVGTDPTPSTIADGFWAFAGSDYVTIDGIDLQESAANTTPTTVMEYGYGLFKASGTNGCQNNTIKNCTITMNRIQNAAWVFGHNGSCGIAMIGALPTVATVLTVTAPSGSNSFNKFYANTIQNCNAGFILNGFADVSPFTNGDTNNDIGGNSAATGNTILNFGGGAATQPATGIFGKDQWGLNCSFNTINNNNGSGINHATTLRGIFMNASSVSASLNCNNNTITVKSGATTSALWGIDCEFGSTPAGNTINIQNNTVQNCTYTTATTGIFQAIYTVSTATNINITGNTITNNTQAGTGAVDLITIQTTPTNVNISNNTITNNSKTATGTMNCISTTNNNTTGIFNGNTITGNTIAGGAAASTLHCIRNASPVTYTVDGNTFSNNGITAMSGAVVGEVNGYINITGTATSETITNNTITNLTVGGTSTGAHIIRGIHTTTLAASVKNISGNTINGLSYTGTAGAATVRGISSGTGGTITLAKNKIGNLNANGTTALVYGMDITAGTTYTIQNNLIGTLTAPAATNTNAIIGINANAAANYSVFYNTIYLNATSSSVTTFGTSCINFINTATAFNLRNNILTNLSTPAQNATNVATNGVSACLRRSAGTAGTVPTNYATTSNTNAFWCNPAAGTNNHVTYIEGTATITNSQNTLAQMKAFMTGRDAQSVEENPNFTSLLANNAGFLHINTSIATQIESGGLAIAGITDDVDGDTRNTSTPDIGADEFTGVIADLTPPAIVYTPLAGTCATTARTLTATIIDASGVPTSGAGLPRLFWRINAGAYTAVTGVSLGGNNYSFTFGAGVTTGDVVSYYIVAQDNATTPNVVASPATGASGYTANPPTAATSPTTPSSYSINSLLNGTYTVGVAGNYPTLTAAVNAYNNSCLTGAVIFELIDATYPTETYPITVLPNSFASVVNTLTIRPAAAIAAPILFSSASTTATFYLNGANYVTLDGRPGGTGTNRYFALENTSTTAAAAGNAILIQNDATNHNLNYLEVRSANANAGNNTFVTTLGAIPGAIAIGSGNGTTGNDNIVIDNCNIHSVSSAGNLCIGVYAGNGTTAGTSGNNDNCSIINCNIYDFFHATLASAAVNVALGNNNFIINNNKVFQTVTRTYTGTQAVRGFWITPNTTTLTSGSGYDISGNIIGYASATGTGVYTMNGAATWTYTAMDLSLGIGTPTSVQGNTITGFNVTNNNIGSQAFGAINMVNGNINVGTITGNLIGSTTSTYGIFYIAAANTGGFMGIRTGGGTGNTFNIANNTVAGINLNSTGLTICPVFNGITASGGTTTNITNNIVGSTTVANSIYAGASTSTSVQSIRGIVVNTAGTNSTVIGNTVANMATDYSATGTQASSVVGIQVAIGTSTVSNNTIFNLTSASQTTSGGGTGCVMGISYTATTDPAVISGNTIYNLKNVHPSTLAGITIQAIFYGGPTVGNNIIEKNFIHSISMMSPTNSAGYLTGMDVGSGLVTIQNNMIRLGLNETGASIISPCTVRGITKNIATSNIWNNTIYIAGSGVGTTATSTFALVRTGTAVDDWRNNILVNNRSNATTGGKHYAINLNATTILMLNNNAYYGTGTGYVFGTANGGVLDVPTYSAGWVTTDVASFVDNPPFVNANGAANAVDLHINPISNTQIESGGASIGTVTNDYDNDIRFGNTGYLGTGTAPDVGADEFNGVSPAPIISNVTYTPAACNAVSHTITATITTLAGSIASANILYAYNGTAQTPIAMTNTSGSTWTGTIPAATSPTNATVTWGITAQSSGGYTTNYIGIPYYDNPLAAYTLDVNASTTNICGVGNPTTLNVNLPKTTAVTVGAGATTSATYSNPFYALNSNSHTQHLITAAELLALGLNAGQITSLGIDITATGGLAMLDFSIKMGNSNVTSLSTFAAPTFTNVFSATTFTPIVGVNTFIFTTPFVWDGTSNVIIEFCHGNSGSTGAMTRTCRFDNTSYLSTINARRTTLTTGTVICGDVTSNISTFGGRPQFIFNSSLLPSISWLNGASVVGTTSPLTLTPSVTTTYTATITVLGCTVTPAPTITVSVNPTPTAPTANNSNQCVQLPALPTASVSSTAGVVGSGSFFWYSAPTGGTLLQVPTMGALQSVFFNDFSGTPPYTNATISGNAFVSAGQFNLFPNALSQQGGITINGSGMNSDKYQIDFDVTTVAGADGFSYSFGDDVSALSTTPAQEKGSGTKLKIGFDSYGTPPNQQGIYLFYNNTATTITPAILGSGFIGFSNYVAWLGVANQHVTISINNQGQLSLTVGGVQVFNNVQLPSAFLAADKSAWRHVIAGRTGGVSMACSIDNLDIKQATTYLTGSTTYNTPISSSATFYVSEMSTNGCLSPRTTVNALISPAPALALTQSAASTCTATPTTLNVSAGTLGNYTTYSWSGGTPSGSPLGAAVVVSPTSNTTYTVYASGGGCTATASVPVSVKPNAAPVTATSSLASICAGNTINLSATANTGAVTILSENFNSLTPGTITSGTLPTSWTGASQTAGVLLWGAVLNIQNSANLGGGNFLYCESTLYTTAQTKSRVETPVFDASGLVSADVSFKHFYKDVTAGAATDSAKVLISNDGGTTYSILAQYDATQGSTANLSSAGAVLVTLPIAIPLTNNMKLRFVYNSDAGGGDGYWAIDDIAITGTPTLQYSWISTPAGFSATTQNPTGVSPTATTDYKVIVTNGLSCKDSATATVTVTPTPTAVVSGGGTGCPNTVSVSIALTGTDPWNITYTDGTATSTVTASASPYTISGASVNTGTYTVTALSDASCTAPAGNLTGSAVVNIVPRPTSVVSGGGSACITGTMPNVSIALTGAQPWNLTYSNGTTSTTVTGITSSPYIITGAGAGTYTVTALSDANCAALAGDMTGSATVTVINPSGVLSGVASICNGSSTNISVAITGGTSPYTVVYSNGTSNFTVNNYVSGTNISVSPTSTTTYTLVSVTDANTCAGTGNTGSATITVNNASTAAVLSGTTAICGGSANISVAITGGTSPYTVVYSNGTSNFTVNNYVSGTNISVSPTSTTTYTLVSVTDANTCVGTGNTGSAIITVNSVTAAYAGTDKSTCSLTPVTMNATGAGTWSGGAGTFSLNSSATSDYTPALSEVGTTVTLTWTITNPVPCPTTEDYVDITVNGFTTTLAPPVASATPWLADYENTDAFGWTHYYDNAGTPSNYCDDYLVLSIQNTNSGGNAIGHIGDPGFSVKVAGQGAYTLTNATTPYVSAGISWYLMGRYWEVTPAQQPVNDVNVKFYFTNADFNDVNAVSPFVSTSPAQMAFYKINNGVGGTPSYNPDPNLLHAGVPVASPFAYDGTGYWQYLNGVTASVSTWVYSAIGSAHVAEYTIDRFSGGGGGGGTNNPGAFPVELLSFTGYNNGSENILQWTTTKEINNKEFVLMHSIDNRSFEEFATIPTQAPNGISNVPFNYTTKDKDFAEKTYYRLKQVDIDGTSRIYPATIEVNINHSLNTVVSVFPNPAKELLNVSITQPQGGKHKIEVYDAIGKLIFVHKADLTNGTTIIPIDVAELAKGTYIIMVKNADSGTVANARFVKE